MSVAGVSSSGCDVFAQIIWGMDVSIDAECLSVDKLFLQHRKERRVGGKDREGDNQPKGVVVKGRRADAATATANVMEVGGWRLGSEQKKPSWGWERTKQWQRQAPETAPFQKDDCSHSDRLPANQQRAHERLDVGGKLLAISPPPLTPSTITAGRSFLFRCQPIRGPYPREDA
jgi:hypothetical protein